MKQAHGLWIVVLFLVTVSVVWSEDWFVTTNGTGSGTSWSDATNSLQGAIDAISAAYLKVLIR